MDTREEPESRRPAGRAATAPKLVMLLFALALIVAAFLFINSPYFAVGAVVVEGNRYIADEDIYSIAGIPAKVNIFRLSTGDIKHRLLRDLRVAEADVSRRFPATIAITVKERQPLAWAATSYGFVQMDKQGVIMAAVKNIKKINVPIITGVRLGGAYVGDNIETPPVRNVLGYLADLDEATLGQLSEVHIRPAGDLIAYTVQAVVIRIGPPDRLDEKARFTRDILQDIGDKKTAIEYIDLNYASPYIKFRQTPNKE